jgi:hypothetical protein
MILCLIIFSTFILALGNLITERFMRSLLFVHLHSPKMHK